ncbi:hypothetical protein LMANV2_660061 [Leptospira interrogans serovar Manilae]|uniref:Uncharacterized protein n=1 Tax=Leptospira interrogans serovar Manilae TaxID=214675 RepID=A0AAQ1P1Q0_LEPIR|nr:hypothetical protein LMANV2_660061 [Leptospira interrogans serovar Manilae]
MGHAVSKVENLKVFDFETKLLLKTIKSKAFQKKLFLGR